VPADERRRRPLSTAAGHILPQEAPDAFAAAIVGRPRSAEADRVILEATRAFTEPGRQMLLARLRAAVERGHLRADLDAAVDAIQGAVLHTALARRPPQVEHLDSLADMLFAGLEAR